ncbi:MAG: DUF2914 domain-containing protein [candidate division Zixibacteria bacterium]|nr:DUF2914 domain-containing protein [candidate division Zixibacteria bacterium]
MKYLVAIAVFVLGLMLIPGAAHGEDTTAVGLTVETALCTGIEERMPVGTAETFSPYVDQVYLWCKVLGAQDSTSITLVWSYVGEEKARVELPVKSPVWRTWGSKKILPSWQGAWDVKILDSAGDILKAVTFTVAPDTTVAP